MSRLLERAAALGRPFAAAATGFLRGFLGLASPPPGAGAKDPATTASARAALVQRSARRPTCC